MVAVLGEHIKYNQPHHHVMMQYVLSGLRAPNGIVTKDGPKAIGSVLRLG